MTLTMTTPMLLAALLLIAMYALTMAISGTVAQRQADRYNRATTKEEIEATEPPGTIYDPQTRLCHPPDGGPPYRRGEMVVRW